MTMKPVPVLDTGRLAVGLTSREMLEAVVVHTQRTGRPLMLLASRNQVERADLGGGYVSGMTPEAVTDFLAVRRAGNILVCRDHGGPYLRDSEKGCSPEESMERACASVRADVEAGFDIIHLDVHAAQAGPESGDRYECLAELVQTAAHSAKGRNKPLFYEVGTDGNDGTPARPETAREDLARILAIVHPLFYVAQTGSLVREGCQVGRFRVPVAETIASLTAEAGVGFKEHNIDWASEQELRLRAASSVTAFNVAPEFGALQTSVVLELADRFGAGREAALFSAHVHHSGTWRKWTQAPEVSHDRATLLAGHYHYGSQAYEDLVGVLAQRTDVHDTVVAALDNLITRYETALA